MVDTEQLQALALDLPEVTGGVSPEGQIGFEVAGKGLAWAYLAREKPKAKRVPVPGVVAIRCTMETKELLLEVGPERFFTDDHYRGYPAVLVRLSQIEADELAGLLRQAWKIVAPKAIAKRYEV
uniref:MmcQ/YjbR family DNA-binding protein n=1 Tax=uncultured Caulobacter sp. TaxID=158749 RepID=UPI0025E20AC5|nr:MmcQ/YjbR family DNA-binding protein [uncultured Caulobacter sp.]